AFPTVVATRSGQRSTRPTTRQPCAVQGPVGTLLALAPRGMGSDMNRHRRRLAGLVGVVVLAVASPSAGAPPGAGPRPGAGAGFGLGAASVVAPPVLPATLRGRVSADLALAQSSGLGWLAGKHDDGTFDVVVQLVHP